MWAMNKIEAGWIYGDVRDDIRRIHPCLVQFEKLPPAEKRYDTQLAVQTLKYTLNKSLIIACFNSDIFLIFKIFV